MTAPIAGPLVTAASASSDFRRLGLREGDTVLVHASLSSLGWVCGGVQGLLNAFDAVLGDTGTLAVPTFTPDLSDPETWRSPPVPAEWWASVRREMPAYDPHGTPSRNMGAFAEYVRVRPEAWRSNHPQTSLAARGARAKAVCATHPLAPRLGLGTPLARLRDLDARVLLLGVGFARNSAFHLAEYETEYPGRAWAERLVPVAGDDGSVAWRTTTDLVFYEEDFTRMGNAFVAESRTVSTGCVGGASSLLFSMTELVERAGRWMTAHRDLGGDE